MCRLLETIKYENRKLHNLKHHEARMQHAILKNFGLKKKFNLSKLIQIPAKLKGIHKCRIIYDQTIQEIEFTQYNRKRIRSIKLIIDEQINYSHKFENRECITRHNRNIQQDEEIIIVKKGLLRDASYSNIALYNGSEWHTPTYPLLKGTKRAELLEKGILSSKKIKPSDLKHYSRISFINAMNDLDELYLDL